MMNMMYINDELLFFIMRAYLIMKAALLSVKINNDNGRINNKTEKIIMIFNKFYYVDLFSAFIKWISK